MTLLPMKYKTKGASIVLRTIRHGCVRINGYIFEPRDPDGISILNGKRCAFGVYWRWAGGYHREHAQMENFVSLWGSEEMYQCVGEDDDGSKLETTWTEWIDLIDDGNKNRWSWWELSKVQSVAFSKRREATDG